MKKIFILLMAGMIACCHVSAQKIYFGRSEKEMHLAMQALAKEVMILYKEADRSRYFTNLMRMQIIAGEYSNAVISIDSARMIAQKENMPFNSLLYLQFELFAKSKMKQAETNSSFDNAFGTVFRNAFRRLDDKSASHIQTAFITLSGVQELEGQWQRSWTSAKNKDSLDLTEAINLCRNFVVFELFRQVEPLAKVLLSEDDNRRYIIDDSVLIKTKDGATISAIVTRKRSVTVAQPAVLVFTIYAEENNINKAKIAAAYGYAGIVAYTRGKYLSPDSIIPYIHDGKDANEVIDWISRQSWCDGKVGMYSGSYDGFTQWAATKYMHPALKTIVPYVAVIPGLGLPMENNVFLNANYGWLVYVSNNKYLDNKAYYNPPRWNGMMEKWYNSGVAYRKIDSVDGAVNTWLQRSLQHPSFDKFWQDMVPYKQDFAKINIPILSITGYYDDAQISAIQYFKDHYKYNKNADHYFLIGPWDHFNAQRGGDAILRDYKVDPIALVNTREITFQWFDYVLKGGKKPELIKDKINYEVMGANQWRHAPSLERMSNDPLTLYLTNSKEGNHYKLGASKPGSKSSLDMEVNLAERTSGFNYYPFPIIRDSLDLANTLSFISEPFKEPISVSGTFSGMLKASINKKDMDIIVTLFEVTPEGRYFQLSYFLGRASYAKDMSKRNLLVPGKTESIPFERTRMTSRQLSKGSRLLVVLNINKDSFHQVNYGTGKDVSDETIMDAKEPLKIKWYNDSFIKIPASK